jgi:capsular polysaccharide biosynthesis protein/LysM repeat protein
MLIVWRKRSLILTAFLSTLLATAVFTYLQTPVYEATSTFVVSPTGTYRDAESLAGVLDAMSRRAELANTYAKVAASRLVKQEVADELGLSEAQREDLAVASELLAGTNVLQISVQGSDASLVWLFANEVGACTASHTSSLYEAYGLMPLDMAVQPEGPVKPSKMLNLALGAVLGGGLGVALAFVTYYLGVPVEGAEHRSEAETQATGLQQGAIVATRTTWDRALSWIVVIVLAFGVMAMGSALFLSGPRTSAAVLPVSRPVPTFVPAAVWTPTPTVVPAEATALAASPTPTVRLSPTPCNYPTGWVPYEVQVTDTLSSLAERYDLSVTEIADANCLTRRVISAGQLLYFPPPPVTATLVPTITVTRSTTVTSESSAALVEPVTTTGEPSPTACLPPEGWTLLHAVEAGESLYSLALDYGVTVSEIMAANCLEGTSLSAGQQLLYLPPPVIGPNPTAVNFTTLTNPTAAPPTATVPASNTEFRAPVLVSPADGSEFGATAEVVLGWRSVQELPADGYYEVTVVYLHLGETWYDDVPWTRSTSWTLSEHNYLLELSDNGEFQWSVQVVRQTGVDAEGRPVGEALSGPSESRRLNWKQPSGGAGRTPAATPPVPPP